VAARGARSDELLRRPRSARSHLGMGWRLQHPDGHGKSRIGWGSVLRRRRQRRERPHEFSRVHALWISQQFESELHDSQPRLSLRAEPQRRSPVKRIYLELRKGGKEIAREAAKRAKRLNAIRRASRSSPLRATQFLSS